MATITAGMVKDLREKTGAGMMDCKTALTETNGDFEKAVDWLRKKGLAKAAKKAGRTGAEGLIGIATKADCGAIVEVNSETDFVARGADFQNYVRKAARQALEEEGELERLLMSPFDSGATMADALNGLIAKIGENLSVRRSAGLAVSPGVVASYIHNAVAPDLGKIGVIVALMSDANVDRLLALGKQIAMHIAAASPIAISPADVPADVAARERAIYADQAPQSGKPG